MGQITTQLGHLFAQTIPTVIFVIFLLAVLDRLFFRPLSKTLDARARATSGALAEARNRAAQAEERLREYERAIHAARQEIYHHREDARNESLSERENKIREARAHAESMVNEAKADLDRESAMAKATLRGAVESLAVEVTETFFAPHIPDSGRGGVEA